MSSEFDPPLKVAEVKKAPFTDNKEYDLWFKERGQ
jgi:hypothetical protein